MRKVAKEKAFYFFTSIGNYTGESASSIQEFLSKVREISSESLKFHIERGDFQKWLSDVWGYSELAKRLEEIEKTALEGELLRARIKRVITEFLELRKSLSQKKTRNTHLLKLEEYLKQLPSPPDEHAYELKMEKRLKEALKKEEDR